MDMIKLNNKVEQAAVSTIKIAVFAGCSAVLDYDGVQMCTITTDGPMAHIKWEGTNEEHTRRIGESVDEETILAWIKEWRQAMNGGDTRKLNIGGYDMYSDDAYKTLRSRINDALADTRSTIDYPDGKPITIGGVLICHVAVHAMQVCTLPPVNVSVIRWADHSVSHIDEGRVVSYDLCRSKMLAVLEYYNIKGTDGKADTETEFLGTGNGTVGYRINTTETKGGVTGTSDTSNSATHTEVGGKITYLAGRWIAVSQGNCEVLPNDYEQLYCCIQSSENKRYHDWLKYDIGEHRFVGIADGSRVIAWFDMEIPPTYNE